MKQIRLTPALLEAAYNLLKEASPFKKWKLPPSKNITFIVSKHKDQFGDYEFNGKHIISLSQKAHGQLITVLQTIAHEMIHIKNQLNNIQEEDHGEVFNKLADEICLIHGFDRNVF